MRDEMYGYPLRQAKSYGRFLPSTPRRDRKGVSLSGAYSETGIAVLHYTIDDSFVLSPLP